MTSIYVFLLFSSFFRAHSFDKVEMKNYTVLLSTPDDNKANFVEVISESGGRRNVIYTSKIELNSFNAYCAYSPAADVEVK